MAVNYDLTDPFHWFKSSDILFTKLREIEASPSVLDEPGSFTRMDLSKMETFPRRCLIRSFRYPYHGWMPALAASCDNLLCFLFDGSKAQRVLAGYRPNPDDHNIQIREWIYPRWGEIWLSEEYPKCNPILDTRSWFLDFVNARLAMTPVWTKIQRTEDGGLSTIEPVWFPAILESRTVINQRITYKVGIFIFCGDSGCFRGCPLACGFKEFLGRMKNGPSPLAAMRLDPAKLAAPSTQEVETYVKTSSLAADSNTWLDPAVVPYFSR